MDGGRGVYLIDGTTYVGTIDGCLTDKVTGRGLYKRGSIYSMGGYPWDLNNLQKKNAFCTSTVRAT